MDISPEWKDRVRKLFPDLEEGVSLDYTSEVDFNYNCLAWALGCNTKPFEKGKGSFWEWPQIPDDTAEGWAKVCEAHGFAPTDNADMIPGVEKIAILQKEDEGEIWLHAARQDRNGRWKSKLGDMGPDIDHDGLRGLEGAYGKVVYVLEKKRQDWMEPTQANAAQ